MNTARTRAGRWSRRGRLAVRTLLGTGAALAVGALALAAAALVTGEFPGSGSWSIAAVLAAVVTGGLGWPPARRWASSAAAQLTHGPVRSAEDVVRAFGRRAGRDVPDGELFVQLAEALVSGMRATSVELWRDSGSARLSCAVSIPNRSGSDTSKGGVVLDPGARRVLVGGGVVGRAWAEMWQPELLDGLPPGEVRIVPATHAGQLLGLIIVARAASADRFGVADDMSLAELGSRLGVLLHSRALDATLQNTLEDLRATNSELRASRVRLVATADAERRRIERDLHDGAQQHLVALAVNLKLAGTEIADDPSLAPQLFAALGDDVRNAINELRALAHGIYPPLLMDAGLVEALRVSARRSPSRVAFRHHGVGRYPPEIEAATYFCCMEALQNAAKHAPGAAVRLTVESSDDELRFTVEDDGPGLDAAALQFGHGLGNMLDRVVAVGGTLEVGRSASNGARVAGSIPVPAAPGATPAIVGDGM